MPVMDLSDAMAVRVANKEIKQLRINNKDVWVREGVFGEWAESRKNLFGDPRAYRTSTYWTTSATSFSTQSGAAFGQPNAARFTALSAGASRGGMRYMFLANTNYTVRFKVRASVAWSPFALYVRNDPASATGQTIVATGIPLTTEVLTLEYNFTTGSTVPNASTGIYLVTAAGATGRWFEITEVTIELGDTRAMLPRFFDGATTKELLKRYRWEGSANLSPSIMDVRTFTPDEEDPLPTTSSLLQTTPWANGHSINKDNAVGITVATIMRAVVPGTVTHVRIPVGVEMSGSYFEAFAVGPEDISWPQFYDGQQFLADTVTAGLLVYGDFPFVSSPEMYDIELGAPLHLNPGDVFVCGVFNYAGYYYAWPMFASVPYTNPQGTLEIVPTGDDDADFGEGIYGNGRFQYASGDNWSYWPKNSFNGGVYYADVVFVSD